MQVRHMDWCAAVYGRETCYKGVYESDQKCFYLHLSGVLILLLYVFVRRLTQRK